MPESEHFDAADFGIHWVVEVIAGPAEEKAADALLLGVASPCPDARLGGDELEGSLEVVDEGERDCRPIGSPPCRGPPDLRRRSRGRLDDQACCQGLLAKFSEEGRRIDELALSCLLERLFEGDLFVGGQLEGLIGFRHKNGDG